MNKDIIIVDDDEGYCFLFSDDAQEYNLNPISFTRPSQALEYLMKRDELPLACFVDIKPYLQQVIEETDPSELPELPFPERLFDYFNQRGAKDRFYFISTHFSQFDRDLIKRTGVNFLHKWANDSKDHPIVRKLEEIVKGINS